MPFRVYGIDGATRQPRPPLDYDVATEEAARARAAEAGMLVESVEFVGPASSPSPLAGEGGGGAAPAGAPKWYEFTPEQNVLIGDLAGKMRFVGFVLIAIGFLTGLYGAWRIPQQGPFVLVQSVLTVLLGLFSMTAANSFRQIVDTQGRDITHLMNALDSLRGYYGILYWVAIVVLVFLAIAAIFTLTGGFAR